MNRKLIRTTLAEVKEREAHQPVADGGARLSGASASSEGASGAATRSAANQGANGQTSNAAATGRKRQPAAETNAEVFYYKKQIESHTPMVIVLQDGEEVEGAIEWYDRNALKVNRKTAPNIMLLKHNIKYMYKAEDREAD